jgi:hypothetical protein
MKRRTEEQYLMFDEFIKAVLIVFVAILLSGVLL